MIIKTDTGTVIPDLTHAIPDIGVQAIMTLIGVTPDHFIDLHILAPPTTETQAHTTTAMIHHTADLHPTDIFSQDDNRSQQHNSHRQHYKPAQGSSSSSKMTPWECKDRRHKQFTIDDLPSEYYSLDDQDSDSEDDLN